MKPDRRALEAVSDALDDRWLKEASPDEMMQLIASGYFGTLPEIAGGVERTSPVKPEALDLRDRIVRRCRIRRRLELEAAACATPDRGHRCDCLYRALDEVSDQAIATDGREVVLAAARAFHENRSPGFSEKE